MATPRSTGSFVISFGLVSIPVKLYTATESDTGIGFHMLHDKCKKRLTRPLFCETCSDRVPFEQAIKGMEVEKDRWVTFTAAEIKALEEKSSGSLDITSFVPTSAVDPLYFEKPCFLGPNKGGAKAYSLLHEVLLRSGKVAIGRWAARGKQYVVLLRASTPVGGVSRGIVMHQLYYAHEVRDFADVPIEKVDLRDTEIDLAEQLVETISADTFDPAAFHDETRDRILAEIARKAAGNGFAEVSASPEAKPVTDLMEALKASLKGKEAKEAKAEKGKVKAEKGKAREKSVG